MQGIAPFNNYFFRSAKFMAVLWTLLIFIGCFTPSKEIPKVDVPLIDKWVHIVMFAGFGFWWLMAFPKKLLQNFVITVLAGIATGGAIELLQGALTSLGRSCEFMDWVADSLGCFIGALCTLVPISQAKKSVAA